MREGTAVADTKHPAEAAPADGELALESRPKPATDPRRTGHAEAFCFTSGFKGAGFAAGTVHALLAADRRAPVLVAGISMGAVNAAVLQSAYRELEADEHGGEAARWAFLRRYVHDLAHEPLKPVWDSLPSLVDFVSDRPPIHDQSVPRRLQRSAVEATLKRYLLVRLGRWLSRLHVKVSTVARAAVAYVRFREDYPEPRWLRGARYMATLYWLGFRLVLEVALRPGWVNDERLRRLLRVRYARAATRARGKNATAKPFSLLRQVLSIRPLFGWAILGTAWAILLAPVLVALVPLVYFALERRIALVVLWGTLIPLASFLVALFATMSHWKVGRPERRLARVLRGIGLDSALVHDFAVRRAFTNHFGGREVTITGEEGVPGLLVVVTPLRVDRTLDIRNAPQPSEDSQLHQQDWAAPGVDLVSALVSAISLPPLFPARSIRMERRGLTGQAVDGAVVRQNPLPALFMYLHRNKRLAQLLALTSPEDPSRSRVQSRPAIHVVYNVPIADKDAPEQPLPETESNVIDVALRARRLARRRDTQLEVEQTNFISTLERERWEKEGVPDIEKQSRFPISADEIAPEKDLFEHMRNPLAPKPEEVLANVAAGCRRTLERLYADEIREIFEKDEARARKRAKKEETVVACVRLVREVAQRRNGVLSGASTAPGLLEVCKTCSGKLRVGEKEDPKGKASGAEDLSFYEDFTRLRGSEPRIVLAMSGGVFRGAFHIGQAGALLVADVRPDLIVGASVGTLFGGAVAALFRSSAEDREKRLKEFVEIFTRVDEHIALTRRLKGAFRDLGHRARVLRLSPNALRRMVRRGSRSDAGFAATGAPPALIDAIADLFLISRRSTARIAAEFVAGHISRGAQLFLAEVKFDALRRLDVLHELMGVSLLEPVVRRLCGAPGADLTDRQPYHPKENQTPESAPAQPGIAFFATATDLGTERAVLLGDETPLPGEKFDFVSAALASSAFPAVFAPRRQCEVFPGTGHPDVRYSDGGMYDNLPILPAMGVLSKSQRAYRASRSKLTALQFLQARYARPDLILVGALDALPAERADRANQNIFSLSSEISAYGKNVKVTAMEAVAQMVDEQVGDLLKIEIKQGRDLSAEILDKAVTAAVLPVLPTDQHHLNGTFAFCASLGLDVARVRLSIADGCFRTLRALSEERERRVGASGGGSDERTSAARRSLEELRKLGRIRTVREWDDARALLDARSARRRRRTAEATGQCPYFAMSSDGNEAAGFECPFHAAAPKVFEACVRDQAHGEA